MRTIQAITTVAFLSLASFTVNANNQLLESEQQQLQQQLLVEAELIELLGLNEDPESQEIPICTPYPQCKNNYVLLLSDRT